MSCFVSFEKLEALLIANKVTYASSKIVSFS